MKNDRSIFSNTKALWLRFAGILCFILYVSNTGCATTNTIHPDVVYFPSPPSKPHAVHLKSFNRLHELIPRKIEFAEWFRGEAVGPYISRPAGIAYQNNHLYICDAASAVVHDWDLSNGKVNLIGHVGTAILKKPVAVAVDDHGFIYVADTERGEVIRYDKNGHVLDRYAPENRDAYKPTAIAIDNTTLYVADAAQHTVDMFYINDGQHVGEFGGVGSEPGKFYYPTGLAIDQNKNVVASDMLNSRVQVIAPTQNDSKPALVMGQPGNRYGDMGKPKHIAVGPDGVIFVADSEFSYVHLFNEKGQLLMMLGGPDDQPGGTPMPFGVTVAQNLPESIASWVPENFDAHYFLFVTNSLGAKRISLYAIGRSH